VPLLAKWLAPFAGLDAARVVSSGTTGTDHLFLQSIGLPGFQFIQDPLDYETRLHHTNIDTYDHLRMDDLRQAAVVMAGMLWQAANDEQELPREPLPTQPLPSDPFAYELP
jgi:Zn-dependent M28 family amino/carboxypeptidase